MRSSQCVHLQLVPEFLLRFIAWMLVHCHLSPGRRGGTEHIPAAGPCTADLQSRRLCRRIGHFAAVPAAGALHHGRQHLSHPGHQPIFAA
jgi:hypothetical protein